MPLHSNTLAATFSLSNGEWCGRGIHRKCQYIIYLHKGMHEIVLNY